LPKALELVRDAALEEKNKTNVTEIYNIPITYEPDSVYQNIMKAVFQKSKKK
jgi:hypothetical protein